MGAGVPDVGLIIVGDEILSGKRADKHLARTIELLSERGLSLAWARYVGDDRRLITAALRDALAGEDIVFCCGGIGATPDDHTRQCAAAALQVPLVLHPQARELILERMRDVAAEQGLPFEPDRADNIHRLNMGVFPEGAALVPNPYNKIPGFHCTGAGGAQVFFLPGFPVMAWPMMAWALDTHCARWFHANPKAERSIIVFGAMEASLTPLMERIEAEHPGVKVFSLPSVDHPELGKHIELGVKGEAALLDAAYATLRQGLEVAQVAIGPEMVRK